MNARSQARPHNVFVDTAAYYALTDERDHSHLAARRAFDRLTNQQRRLITTNFILAEVHALLLHRLGRSVAARVLEAIDTSRGTVVVRISEAQERRAREIIARYDDKDFSLTDANSFAVMEEFGIRQAFTFDSHFAQFGFMLVR